MSVLTMCSQCAPWVYGSLPPVCRPLPGVLNTHKSNSHQNSNRSSSRSITTNMESAGSLVMAEVFNPPSRDSARLRLNTVVAPSPTLTPKLGNSSKQKTFGNIFEDEYKRTPLDPMIQLTPQRYPANLTPTPSPL